MSDLLDKDLNNNYLKVAQRAKGRRGQRQENKV